MEFFRRKELFTNKIGTDEVGRGPLAGPVIASSVLLLNNDLKILDQLKELKVTDSKKISEKRRSKDLLIGLASIIAKEYRDTLMKEYDHIFPGYNFGKHSGYPTKEHKESIKKLGPSPIHRLSFKGVLSD